MKKLILLIFLLLPHIFNSPGSAIQFLKLRASYHPTFLRIVIEGERTMVTGASVFQRDRDIIVTFPQQDFAVESEQTIISYKRADSDSVLLSPGEYSGLKVFTLDRPYRLVIDVYLAELTGRFSSQYGMERSQAGRSYKPRLVIDPGHGGYDFGISGSEYSEKNVVLDIARKLRAMVEKGSSEGYLTRSTDLFMSMSERVDYARKKDADVFLSIHIGKHREVYLYLPVITDYTPKPIKQHLANPGQEEYLQDSVVLLNAMKDSFSSAFGDDMIVVSSLPYGMLSKIDAAALLVELPSFQDANYIDDLRSEIASALYRGLYIYEEIRAK